ALKVYLVHQPEDQESLDLLERIKPSEKPAASESIPALEELPGPVEKSFDELSAAPQEEIAEILTPKLAEIYFDQGLIQEAINTYKKVIEQNPENETSIKRLEELKTMMEVEEALDDTVFDKARSKKQKMIIILEGWLDNIRRWAELPLKA
ncbi:MAG: tetratricopeptide repeat protein, partial [Thermodesulfobacteriota bacterium]|nr:tetratricopeptide repeat protein [Thermodesulfobacteriota bacterium]